MSHSATTSEEEVKDQTERDLTVDLVKGYMRNHSNYYVNEIVNLCMMFYGYYSKYLVYWKDHKHWFQNINKSEVKIFGIKRNWYGSLDFEPFTQFIDDTYQIVNVTQRGWDCYVHLKISSFLCVNMKTNEVHTITANTNDNKFQCLISEPLILNAWMTEAAWTEDGILRFPEKEPVLIPKQGKASKKLRYTIWHKLEQHLWDLFICNRLYDPTQDIKDQEIWKVIQFLSLFYFEKYQYITNYSSFKIPQLILEPMDRPQFSDEPEPEDDYSGEYKFKVNDNYKHFNVDKDCRAEITEYEQGVRLKCKCYLFVDWGEYDQGYTDGFDENLYCVDFEIEKPLNDVVIKFEADFIQRGYWKGDMLDTDF